MKNFLYAKTRTELPYLLNYLQLVGTGIEIGVYTGNYSKCILERSHLKTLYICDTWSYLDNGYEPPTNKSDETWEHIMNEAVKKISFYNGRYLILRKRSIDAVKEFSDNTLDFVYIDADHRYEYVKEDIEKWFPKVKSGGVFAGHDYFDGNVVYFQGRYFPQPVEIPLQNGMEIVIEAKYFGVKKAVDEFFGKIISVTNETFPSWYVIK